MTYGRFIHPRGLLEAMILVVVVSLLEVKNKDSFQGSCGYLRSSDLVYI